MPRRSVLTLEDPALVVNATLDERRIAMQPVLLKVQIVVDQQRTDIGVVADAVSANPGINQGYRHNEQSCQPKNPLPPLRLLVPRSLNWQAHSREDICHDLIVWRVIAASQIGRAH